MDVRAINWTVLWVVLGIRRAAALLVVLPVASWASAEPIGASSGAGESVVSSFNWQEIWFDGWSMRDAEMHSQDVSYDPARGPWVRELNTAGEIVSGTVVRIEESVDVDAAGAGWVRWHEEIVTDGWSWYGQLRIELLGGPGADAYSLGVIDDRNLDFDFSWALWPEDSLNATLRVVYDAEGAGLDPFTGALVIRAYPVVPEPSVFLLALSGLVVLPALRRYQQR